jgi:response regulator RpfG family c-di-GMP phosphodiesterase
MKYSEELSTLYHKEKKASKELKEKLESLSLSQKQSLLYAEELRKTYLKEKQEAARLRRALKNIEETYESTLLALVNALDVREHETHNHSQRVMEYTLEMAKKAGIKGKELVDIGRGSLLHDIGKIGSPDSILMKQDDLTKRQWEEIKKHPSIGFRILKGIKFLEGASRIVLTHSEHFAIPIGSRLFAVVDAFDAMTSNRPYRKAMGYEAAKKEIKKYSGTQFDPWAVDIFLSVPRKRWTEISKKVQSAL